MRCRGCGKEAKAEWCSNACFVEHRTDDEGKRTSKMCAICYVDPKTGRRGTDRTTRLCDACRRDPANAGWSETWEGVDTTADVVAAARPRGGEPQRSLATVEGRPLKPATERERKILLLLAFGDLTMRQVAERVGCSVAFVHKVVKRYWQ
jgi:hypothetical protein